MVTAVGVVTEVVEILKFAVVEPAGTVTDAGTVATALFEESETAVPPEGAAEARVTAAELELIPITALGDKEIDDTAG